MKTGQPSITSSIAEFERLHVRPKEGPTLIVGSKVYREKEDRRKRYTNAIGVDMQEGEGVDWVQDLEESLPLEFLRRFDHVECMSVLEHSRRPWLMAANIERMLRVGGTLYVTVPFVWAVHGYPDDYWRMTLSGIEALFPHVQWHARAYAAQKIVSDVKRHHISDFPYFPRSEACAFGVFKP